MRHCKTIMRPVHLCTAEVTDETAGRMLKELGKVARLSLDECRMIQTALADWYEREWNAPEGDPLNVEALAIFAFNQGRCSK